MDRVIFSQAKHYSSEFVTKKTSLVVSAEKWAVLTPEEMRSSPNFALLFSQIV